MDRPGAVVVTGAAGGIGQALVRAFAAAGHLVIATDRAPRPPGLPCGQYLELELASTVADPCTADEVFMQVRRWAGPGGLHALVNNAALQELGGVETLTRAAWRDTLDVNLLAPFIWTQALLPQLEAAQGSVVNISSIHARQTKPGFVAYATSKAALSGMTRAMAVDLQGRVRVNAIEPAAIATEMLKAGFAGQEERYARLEAFHPQGRIGTPQEVAALALALTRGELRFLHGACVGLDGAISARLHDPD